MRTARNLLAAVAAAVLVALTMIGLVVVQAASAAEGCTNEARRVEQGSTFLPDCRAYELATPPNEPSPSYYLYSEGVAPNAPTGFPFPEEPANLPKMQASVWPAVDGNTVLFQSSEPNSRAPGKRNNLLTRGSNGWTGENIEPPQSRRGFLCNVAGYVGFSQNLQQVLFVDGYTEDEGGSPSSIENCGLDEPPLVADEPRESGNLFLRDTSGGSFQLVNLTPSGTTSYQPWFDATSPDGSHVVFSSRAQLTTDALPDSGVDLGCQSEFGNLYVWSGDAVHLLTVLPNGTAARGTLAGAHLYGCDKVGPQSADITHALSTDGERVLFYAGGGFQESEGVLRGDAPYLDGGLYLREHPGAEQSALNGSDECTEPQKACTIQIDLPEGVSGSGGNGQFQWANADTTKVFFTDEEKLTPDATAAAGKPDLYEYDLEKPAGQRVTDLTVDAAEPADVLGVSGASEDGSYVYFVAESNLTGAQQNSHGESAIAPAQGNGILSGGAEGTGTVTLDSNRVTGLSAASGEFRVGQEIEGELLAFGTVITACIPNCSAPTELTLSLASPSASNEGKSVKIKGRGSNKITGVNITSGAFHAGMAISGPGISPGTWITEVGAGALTLSRGVEAEAEGTQALSATAGNLYVSHAGTTTFVAALTTEVDRCDWTMYCLTSRVSQNGLYIGFDSFSRLTGYNNLPVHPNACTPLTSVAGSPCPETFRYAEAVGAEGELTCASCDPSGAPPASDFAWSIIGQAARESGQLGYTMQVSNNVSDSGEVFFETMEGLVPTDKNETWDVYQYDGGEGEGAQLYLISSGESDLPSYFMDATPDGSNVFFVTFQPLLRADTRTDYDLYDARVDGGFASQSEAVQPPSCEALEACRSPLSEPPVAFSVASAALVGSGNLKLASEQPEVKKSAKKPTPKKLTREQRLERALKTCAKRYRHSAKRRRSCERESHKRYGSTTRRAGK